MARDKIPYPYELHIGNPEGPQPEVGPQLGNINKTFNGRLRDTNNTQSNTEENIINLSNVQLNSHERAVISRGLTFCPTTGRYNQFTLLQDLDNFARNLRLEEYFFDKPQRETTTIIPSSSRQQWTPSSQREKHLDTYIEAVQKDILREYNTHRPASAKNLSRKEYDSLKALSERTDIVIKPADKGGGIVILNKSDYIQEGTRQLTNTSFYKPLDKDPTLEHQAIINTTLHDLVELRKLHPKHSKALTVARATPGRFYMLPKIHKKKPPADQ